MSYKVLARKWRPQRFEDMLGQEPVLRALVNALDTDRLHHAYLFTGMRGVGKTTIARIFAKCLNCEEKGVSSTPCGACSACQDIEAGRFLDLIEVDAASRTKVDETRELLENVPYAPASGRYKVYLIDEVHMFSNASFNALLKTLEEPPEHVKFLLATTDPQKVPVTVLSRCLQFNLRRMATDALAEYLAKILGEEGVEAEAAALDLISRASEGSVRDSLSLVEQAAAFGQGAVRVSEVETMLGRVSLQRLAALLDALARGDIATLFARIDELASYAPDFTEVLGEILGLLHRVALMQSVPETADASVPGHEGLANLAETVSPEEIQLWYQIGQHARRDLPFSTDPREGFDMALLRMHGFRPQLASGSDVPAAISGSPVVAVPGTAPGSAPGTAPAAAPASAGPKSEDASPKGGATDSGDSVGVLPVRGTVSAGDARDARAEALSILHGAVDDHAVGATDAAPAPVVASVSATASGTTPDAAATASMPVQTTSVAAASPAPGSLDALAADRWSSIVEQLGVSGMPRQLASNAVVERLDGNTLHLLLETGQDHLNSPRFVDRLAQALTAWAGEAVSIAVRLNETPTGSATLDTPLRQQSQGEASALESARRSIQSDERLARLVADVEGTIDPANVRPLTPSTD